ncbi:T9SS type A sorting domain-containing protein, partial [candidate division WOR-3 bacterium]|nr:T9SS type A sorting domain-containing protein [candidate division WOR-3 bacterium]
YKTNEINANVSILYNNVINSKYDTFSFLIQADTNNINIHFYDISCSDSIVNGIQFDNEHYLGFSGDSFYMSNGIPLIRDSMSISFSNVPPVLATKFFFERFTGTHKPILMSGSLYYKNNDFVIGVFENNIYSVNLYDLNGRLCQELDNGIIRKGTYHYKNEQQVSGVYFLIINNGKEVLLRRKIVIFQ